MSKHTFETVAGDVIEIRPISILDLQLAESAAKKWCKEQGYKLEPPTYEVEALGGEIEYHPHSEITIQEVEDGKVLAEWEDYLQDNQRMREEVQKRTAYVFLDGMVINLPQDDSWAKRRERLFGETIPTNEDDLKLYYVNNVLLKTPADKQNIMLEIQKLSLTGVSEEAIQAMENLFRRRMGQRKIKSTIADISQEDTK